MANNEQYDADGDVLRYLLDPTTDIAMFSEPVAVAVETHTTPPTVTHAEQQQPPPAAVIRGQTPVHPSPDLDLLHREVHIVRENPTPVIHADGFRRRQTTAAVLHGSMATSSTPDCLLAGSRFQYQADDADTHGHGDSSGGGCGGGAVVEKHTNLEPFLPLLPGQLDCSRCHLVRHVMHATAVSRRILKNDTREWAGDFIACNVEIMRNNTSGQLLDSGFSNFVEAVHNNIVDGPHRALEVNMLQTIISTPSADHQNAAVEATLAEQSSFSAALPAAAPQMAGPEAHHYAGMLLAVEQFYTIATSGPALMSTEVEILESSHVTQQEGDRAITYPSLQDQKGKGKMQAVQGVTTIDVLEYLRLTREETEKEIKTLSSFDGIHPNDGALSYLVQEVSELKKKICSLQRNALHITVLPSNLLGSMKMIGDIKIEKARAYARFIGGVKDAMRKGIGASYHCRMNSGTQDDPILIL
uniref:Uncharacterized protein n=1 Tax=Leersia perrieri TaxID=77586 RepID=A0A0D9X6E2_9ORYZ